MTTLILPTPTIDDLAAEDFDPIPLIAMAHGRVPLVPFRLGLPNGDGTFTATFEWDSYSTISEAAIRYTQTFPPVFQPLRKFINAWPGDVIVMTFKP